MRRQIKLTLRMSISRALIYHGIIWFSRRVLAFISQRQRPHSPNANGHTLRWNLTSLSLIGIFLAYSFNQFYIPRNLVSSFVYNFKSKSNRVRKGLLLAVCQYKLVRSPKKLPLLPIFWWHQRKKFTKRCLRKAYNSAYIIWCALTDLG